MKHCYCGIENFCYKKAEGLRGTATPCPVNLTRGGLGGQWKMDSTTVRFIKARSYQTNKIFDKVNDSWGKSNAVKQICLDYATRLTESFRENYFNMEQTARSTGHHQVQRLLNGTQDTKRGRLSEVHLRDQSGGKITSGVLFKDCMCGYQVCDHHKAGSHCYKWGPREREHTNILEMGWGGAFTLNNKSFYCNFGVSPVQWIWGRICVSLTVLAWCQCKGC